MYSLFSVNDADIKNSSFVWILYLSEKREWIAELRNDTQRIKEMNEQLESNISKLQEKADR